MAWVYILESEKNKSFYVGSTEDIEERFWRHNQGYERATKPYRPYKIVFKQKCESTKQARFFENKIKKWKRRDFIEKIIKSGIIY